MKESKVIFVLVFVCLMFLGGCSKETDKSFKYDELKDKLVSYGTLIYDSYITGKTTLKEGVYSTTIKEMKERIGHDTSMFVNPNTNKSCDTTKTKIELIVKKPLEDGKPNYEFKPTLVCD
ncbi:MAG: hypothetical protein RR228_00575 [Bacilli bacterium]